MNLRRSAAATTAVALLAAVPASNAAAAVPPRDRVHAHDLPTTGQVAEIYPILAGGSREVLSNREPGTPTLSCLAYRNPVRAASGKWAFYLDSDGHQPYFDGYADPTVFVYKFSSVRKAKDGFRTIRRHYARCAGAYTADDGSTTRRTPLSVPEIGDSRYAFRTLVTTPTGGGATDDDHDVDVYVRKGRYLVNVLVQADDFAPGKANTVRLTRLAVRTAG